MSETPAANLEPIVNDRAPVPMDDHGVMLNNLDEAYRFAKAVCRSGLAPKGDTPEAVMVKMQAGRELGFPPMAALACMTAVHGRMGIMGAAALALCRKSGAFNYIRTGNTGEGDARCGFIDAKRRDEPEPIERVTFTLAEAKKAGLAGSQTYKAYEDDMLFWRCVARFSRRYASDVLMGFAVADTAGAPPSGESTMRLPRSMDAPTEPDPLLAADIEDAVTVPETNGEQGELV